jgi:hypothetical protein
MKINVIYDIDKDEKNYTYCLIDKAYPIYGREKLNILPPFASELQSSLEIATNTEAKRKVIHAYLTDKYLNCPLFELSSDTLAKSWKMISDSYLKKLCSYFQIMNYNALPVTCFLTTLRMCPYNRKRRYFYAPLFANLADQTRIVMHELMHIVFLDNYEQYLVEQGVPEQGILDINESLTVLLNLEFKEFLLVEELNIKPSTYDLQAIVNEEYKKSTPFKGILKKLINQRISKT